MDKEVPKDKFANLFIKKDLITNLMDQTQKTREEVIKSIEKTRQQALLKTKRDNYIFNSFKYDPSKSWADYDPNEQMEIIPEPELTESEISDIRNSIEPKIKNSYKHTSRPKPINTNIKYVPKVQTLPSFNDNIDFDNNIDFDININFEKKKVSKLLLKKQYDIIINEMKCIFDKSYLTPEKKIMILLEGLFGQDLTEYKDYINDLIKQSKPDTPIEDDIDIETIFTNRKEKNRQIEETIEHETKDPETEDSDTEETIRKYKKDIKGILKESNIDTISAKKIRKQLEKDYSTDLSDIKSDLDEYITSIFHKYVKELSKVSSPKNRSNKKSSSKKRSSKKSSSKKRSSKKSSSKKRSSKKSSAKKRSSKKSSSKKRSAKKRSAKKRSAKKRSSKKRSAKKRSSKKRSSKKRSSKKRSAKKRSSKKSSAKKRSSKKRSAKKRSSKKRSSKKRSSKKRSTKGSGK